MRSFALALLGSSALFASAALAQTGAATTNAANSNQNQASLADCDRLIVVLDQRKPDDAKVTPDTVRGWKRDNNAGEPLQVSRRPFGLGQAAKAWTSAWA